MSDQAGSARVYLRPASAVAFAAAGALVFAAIATRNPIPLFAAIPLLIGPVAAASTAPTRDARAVVGWTVEGSGADVRVQGTITPTPPVSPDSLDARFYRPPPLEIRAPTKVRTTPTALEFELRWSAPYPFLATVPRPEVIWRDPLGLTEMSLPIETPALKVERFPPEAARLGTVRLRRTTPQPGEIRARQVGAAGEFFAVRAASPTDTPRQINWRASARSGRLLSNDFQLERTGDIVLILDLRPTSLGPERDQMVLNIARAAILGIATGFLSEKSRVGLGVFDEFLTAIPLGTGRLQRYRIAQALHRATLSEAAGPSERLAVSMRRYFPPGVTTVLVSALADDEALLLLTYLRRRGYPTVVLSPSPLPLLTPPLGQQTLEDVAALRLLRLVRRQRIGRAWHEGPVVDWEDYWSLTPFVRFLATPSLARGGNR